MTTKKSPCLVETCDDYRTYHEYEKHLVARDRTGDENSTLCNAGIAVRQGQQCDKGD